VTTHRENTIDRMSLEPDRNEERESVAGSPFDEELVGPSPTAARVITMARKRCHIL
jgi:hypothetical protein